MQNVFEMQVKKPLYINLAGKLMDLSQPRVMGILNLTPDSFYNKSRMQGEEDIRMRVEQMRAEGADMIDVGAYSSRPGAADVSQQEEMARLRNGLTLLRQAWPEAIVSVDTFRADVAKMCVEEYGVSMVNDIYAGRYEKKFFQVVRDLQVPYVMMHMQGTPQQMQQAPHYEDILREVMLFFAERVQQLREMGMNDIILDPGFGFGKTLQHNYELMHHLQEFKVFELPLLVGVSRKSMVYKLLDTTPDEALNGTTALHTIALLKGANILRVHDVKAARETIRIVETLNENS